MTPAADLRSRRPTASRRWSPARPRPTRSRSRTRALHRAGRAWSSPTRSRPGRTARPSRGRLRHRRPARSRARRRAAGSGASVSYQLTLAIPADYALAVGVEHRDDHVVADRRPEPRERLRHRRRRRRRPAPTWPITKTDAADPVVLGDNVVYTITVTNNGPSDAAGVRRDGRAAGLHELRVGHAQPGELLAGRRHRHVSAGRAARRERRDDHRRRGDHRSPPSSPTRRR